MDHDPNSSVGLLQQPANRRAERILVVDDELAIRNAVTEILTYEGFRCDPSADVAGALQSLRTAEYNLVLSDIRMPGLDGWYLLKHVTQHYPDIALIMITGVNEVDSTVEALSDGAVDYLTKPFTVDELRSKISKALEHRLLILGNKRYKTCPEGRIRKER
jgi:DNA-binding NtrC family response regulator